jgi:hypothetical protein
MMGYYNGNGIFMDSQPLRMQFIMQTKKQKIIKLYNDLAEAKVVYPTASQIAKKTKANKIYVWRVIKEYKDINNTFGLKK